MDRRLPCEDQRPPSGGPRVVSERRRQPRRLPLAADRQEQRLRRHGARSAGHQDDGYRRVGRPRGRKAAEQPRRAGRVGAAAAAHRRPEPARYREAMAEPTTERPGIDPAMQALLDAFPFKFTADDGVEVAREQMRQLKAPPEALPDMRIEERTIDYGDITGIPGAHLLAADRAARQPAGGGVLPRRRLGDRRPGHPRPGGPRARRRSRGHRGVGGLPAGARASVTRRASTTRGRRCGGSASTLPNSAATPRASPSPATRRAATSRR